MGGATLSKSLIQFSVDGWGCAPSLLFDLRPNYGGGNEDNGDLLQRSPAGTAALMPPQRLLDTHEQVWVSLLWGLCSFLLDPGVHEVLFVPSKNLFPQFCGSSVIKSHLPSKPDSLGVLNSFARSPDWEICCGSYNFLESVRIFWYNCSDHMDHSLV